MTFSKRAVLDGIAWSVLDANRYLTQVGIISPELHKRIITLEYGFNDLIRDEMRRVKLKMGGIKVK